MRKIRIFLASSAELNADKEQVEIFVSRKNKDWYQKRLFIELSTWKDFISAMTDGRTQDAYNRYIRSCDIAVFLFHTKFGRFTKEEFDHAHDAFTQSTDKIKKPRIYTFFKSDINESTEVADFRKHIDSLNHFYDTYHSMDDLFVKFNQQLDKLENEGLIIKPEIIDWPKTVKYAVYYFLLPLLVLAGSFLGFYYFQPADVTVKVSEVQAIPGLPFDAGNVILTYGDKTETLVIKTEVTFKQIPSKYKHGKAKLVFAAKGFNPIDTLIKVGNLIELPIQRDNSLALIFGTVKDENGVPVADAVVNVKDIQSHTDANGKFKIELPLNMQAKEQRLTAYKAGYKSWDFTGTPSQTIEWKIMLMK